MRTPGERAEGRRRTVAWDRVTGELVVGKRRTVLTCAPGDNECVLRTYLTLVAEQRNMSVSPRIVLRHDDIDVLAELLDLDDADLVSRLERLLQLSATDASDLHRRLRRRKFAAALGVGLLAAVPTAGAAMAEAAGAHGVGFADTASTTTSTATTMTTAATADPAPEPPAADPAPTEAAEPEVEIGWTVTYERDPDFVAPDGVDIGDAMRIERDAPPTDG